MDLVPYLSAVILIATIATILLAVLSYAAFKLRDRRKPRRDASAPVFFTCFDPYPQTEQESGEEADA